MSTDLTPTNENQRKQKLAQRGLQLPSVIEAAQADDRAALRHHDPANTNFPPSDYDVKKGRELP